ncbi:MAG: hypothetical protein WC677_02700 [Clostridia bacterium]
MPINDSRGNELLSRKEAIHFLKIEEKNFDNYHKNSGEIKGEKIRNRWYFNKNMLEEWLKQKNCRMVYLSMEDYEKCFEFAIKMAYGGLSLNGPRGQRSEVQAASDIILGILAEHAIKKFLKEKFDIQIELDQEVHTEYITPQDFHKIHDNGKLRNPRIGVGVKSSKMKNAYLVLGDKEVEDDIRKSNAYIFARVDLPSDHLFRILRDHSFFKRVKNCLENDEKSKKIGELNEIPVWICGITYIEELEKKTEIKGQKFVDYRYVKSVANMHNSESDWISFTERL